GLEARIVVRIGRLGHHALGKPRGVLLDGFVRLLRVGLVLREGCRLNLGLREQQVSELEAGFEFIRAAGDAERDAASAATTPAATSTTTAAATEAATANGNLLAGHDLADVAGGECLS